MILNPTTAHPTIAPPTTALRTTTPQTMAPPTTPPPTTPPTNKNDTIFVIVFGVLLTITFFLQIVITVYWCYKKRKFCFTASNIDKDTPNEVISQVIYNGLEDIKLEPVMSPTVNNWGCLEKTLDVFISYRRSNGSQLASLLRTHLEIRKVSVFLDIDK